MRTMQRTIGDLEYGQNVPLVVEGRRYKIMDGAGKALAPVRFSLQEARALYIATRLFLRHADERDPDGISALEKLAERFPATIADQVRATAQELLERPNDRRENASLRVITEAWAESKTVIITYHSQSAGTTRTTSLDPYILEPSITGAATYVIGYSHEHDSIRTFKIDRIESAEYTNQPFTVDETDLKRTQEQVASSWGGIVLGEDEFDVVLEFASDVASRVSETNWHRTQRLTSLDGGRMRFEVRLPSLMEFVPWVRSWGPAVLVIAPEELRRQVAESLALAVQQYG
jgi:predicted DNA-binding transcriptional regulator YafY